MRGHDMARYQRIVILTGAGISAESGLGTFRDKDGLWTKVNLEDVATPQGFRRNPGMVHDFYNARRQGLRAAKHNAAHAALARLEAEHPGQVLVVTQNVDNLHEQAGTTRLIHMHGELAKARCTDCTQIMAHLDDLDTRSLCPSCAATGTLRPHVVWFGEMPLEMEAIEEAIEACDLFVSIGTSGTVYPAAGFVAAVRRAGLAHTVELNLEPSDGHSLFAERHYGPASVIVPAFVETLLK
ncbi:NAD-dependent deacylase [Oleomonas cavernae]|uniref:NAD-dependent protein deacylase n=2 Tax=Oleomonas cavernae TaxID=2320859 RepID=A0A418WJ52_9PROT|nr:NAD-dependent deacylase [Oleomonas cavernae]